MATSTTWKAATANVHARREYSASHTVMIIPTTSSEIAIAGLAFKRTQRQGEGPTAMMKAAINFSIGPPFHKNRFRPRI